MSEIEEFINQSVPYETRVEFVRVLNQAMKEGGIITAKSKAAFLAYILVESAYFKSLEELPRNGETIAE